MTLPINTIIQGDCLSVMKDWPDNSADLVLTDPLYNIGKDAWDKMDNYVDWFVSWAKKLQRILKKNGTFWFFHMVFPTIAEIHIRLMQQTDFRFKQWITIDKGIMSIAGRTSITALRSFPRASEYLLFYSFEDLTGAVQLGDKYARINPMAKYLRSEFRRAKVSNGQIAALFPSKNGGLTGCVSNWLLGYNFPTKEQYEKMREFLNGEYLRQEYEDLRQEYEDLRYTFNLPQGVTDVWPINFYGNTNNGHPTPKPLDLICRVVETASLPNALILDPFCGSGTTCLAAKMLGRRYIGIEISPVYAEIARKRLEAVDTGVPVKEQNKGQLPMFPMEKK